VHLLKGLLLPSLIPGIIQVKDRNYIALFIKGFSGSPPRFTISAFIFCHFVKLKDRHIPRRRSAALRREVEPAPHA
jgi:hypothetical protein